MNTIKISNERLAAAVRTDDAVAAFKTAVENGQARLALDVLESIIPALIERIEALENVEAAKPSPSAQAKKVTKDQKDLVDQNAE